jgi:WhiB family redox-sensing transcriptional regulator
MSNVFSSLTKRTPDTLELADRWREQAVCADPAFDPELWFPVGEGTVAQQQADDAKAICHGCPSISACLRWAMESGQDTGVWGGLDEGERHNLRRRQRRATAAGAEIQQMATALLAEHSVAVGDHREWCGPTSIRMKGIVTTGKRVAWIAAHGARPDAALITDCDYPTCILPAHMRFQTTGAPDDLTEGEIADYRAGVFTSRSVDVGDGHREWQSSEPVTVHNVSYTARQLAWIVAHGKRPAGVLKVTCGHEGCVTAAHLHDRGLKRQPKAKPPEHVAIPQVDRCGTRSGYDDHMASAEAPCQPCTDARARTDWLLREGGTPLGLTA